MEIARAFDFFRIRAECDIRLPVRPDEFLTADCDVCGFVFHHDPSADEAHKEHRTMLSALAKGDEVTTGGGLVGKVTQVGETYIRLEISEGVEILLQKSAITAILP